MGADRLAEVLARIESLAGNELLIGIPAEDSPRSGEAISNAAIGYVNEYGSPELNIPARPHLIPGVHAALPQCMMHMERAARAQLAGGSEADAGLHRAGLIAVASVQRYLTKGDGFAALSAATLARRKSKGRASDKPLIDTGAYLRSISYSIRPKR